MEIQELNHNKPHYSTKYHRDKVDGVESNDLPHVIEVIPVAVQHPQPSLVEKKQQELPATLLSKKPRNAREAHEMLSVRSAYGQSLVEMYKKGR